MPHRLKDLASLAFAIACLVSPAIAEEPDRSPIALALNPAGTRLLVANQSAGTVSWVDTVEGRVIRETMTGDRPSGVAISGDGKLGIVAHWYSYDLAILDLEGDKLTVVGRVEVGPEPRGVVIASDARTAYVAVGALERSRVELRSAASRGRWP
jgi:YVTN family beta-propeller protein